MFIKFLINFGLWMIQQSWFRTAVVKFVTSAVEKTETEVDDKIVAFLTEHRRALVTIANKEVHKTTSEIDDRFVEALKSVPTKPKQKAEDIEQ